MFEDLKAENYTNLIPAEKFTNFGNTHQYDNIWVRKDRWRNSQKVWANGVIRNGLTYERDNEIKPASDHCPVWASIPYYRNTTV